MNIIGTMFGVLFVVVLIVLICGFLLFVVAALPLVIGLVAREWRRLKQGYYDN